EGERRGEHAPIADGHEIRHSRHGLPLEQLDRISGAGLELGVALAGGLHPGVLASRAPIVRCGVSRKGSRWHASGSARRRLAEGAEPYEGADEGSVLRRLLGGEVAGLECRDRAALVLPHDDEVDETDDVLLSQALELREDLPLQPVLVELEDQHLYRTEFHG